MIRFFWIVFRQQCLLACANAGEIVHGIIFYVLVIMLFPLALGSDSGLLATLGPGIIWIAALLSMLLSVHALYQSDHEDGTLDQWAALPVAMEWIVAAKCLAQWLISAVPLMMLAPLLAVMLHIPPEMVPRLLLSLALSSGTIIAVGGLGAALTVGMKRAGALVLLLVLPLLLPVMIFGVHMVTSVAKEQDAFSFLAGLTLFFIPLSITASAFLLRIRE